MSAPEVSEAKSATSDLTTDPWFVDYLRVVDETIQDLAVDFVEYDRREDEELPVGTIERLISGGHTDTRRLAEQFRHHLYVALGAEGGCASDAARMRGEHKRASS